MWLETENCTDCGQQGTHTENDLMGTLQQETNLVMSAKLLGFLVSPVIQKLEL